MTRPAERIRAVAARLLSAQTMERVIDPVLADLQCEYDEAIERGLLWRARLGLVRSYLAFARALLWLGVRTAWSGSSQSEIARTSVVAAIAVAFTTGALVVPPLLTYQRWQDDPGFTALLSVMLVPQALPVSIPGALCVAVLWTMRGKAVTRARVVAVLAIALALTAAVWIVLEWLMPQANQGFREIVAARLSNGRVLTLQPGLNELGLSRLGQRTDPAAVRQYQLLWALCFASVPLGLLAFGLARYVRRAVSAVALATVVAYSYFAILWVSTGTGREAIVPASMSVWTANVVCACIGCALLARTQRFGTFRNR